MKFRRDFTCFVCDSRLIVLEKSDDFSIFLAILKIHLCSQHEFFRVLVILIQFILVLLNHLRILVLQIIFKQIDCVKVAVNAINKLGNIIILKLLDTLNLCES